MALYQPGVGPGGGGQVIHVPRSCPSGLETERMLALIAAERLAYGVDLPPPSAPASAPSSASPTQPPAERPIPAPVSAEAAIRDGITELCAWFLGDAPYSLDGLRQAAFDAGYARGTSAQIIPLPEMLRQMSFSALGFTAVIADPPPGNAVLAHVSFHDPVCQIQVYGHDAAAEAVLAGLEGAGWRRDGDAIRTSQLTIQRYRGAGLTLVVNRPTEPVDGPGLDLVLNIVGGEDNARGMLEEP